MEVVEGHSRLMATTAPDELYAWSEGRHILFSCGQMCGLITCRLTECASVSYYVQSTVISFMWFREHPFIYLTAHQMVSGVIHSIFSLFPFLPLAHGDPIDRRRRQSLPHPRPEP